MSDPIADLARKLGPGNPSSAPDALGLRQVVVTDVSTTDNSCTVQIGSTTIAKVRYLSPVIIGSVGWVMQNGPDLLLIGTLDPVPYFIGLQTASQAIGAAVWTTVNTLGVTEMFGFTYAAPVATCPLRGVYDISAGAAIDGGPAYMRLLYNGAGLDGRVNSNAGSRAELAQTKLQRLSKGDTVGMQCYSINGGNIHREPISGNEAAWLHIRYVGP